MSVNLAIVFSVQYTKTKLALAVNVQTENIANWDINKQAAIQAGHSAGTRRAMHLQLIQANRQRAPLPKSHPEIELSSSHLRYQPTI